MARHHCCPIALVFNILFGRLDGVVDFIVMRLRFQVYAVGSIPICTLLRMRTQGTSGRLFIRGLASRNVDYVD